MSSHHSVVVRPGPWGRRGEIARPLRATGWTQWRAERRCRKTNGHCWHPDARSMVGWWCCMCSGETDGMPAQKCVHCLAHDEGANTGE